MNHEFVDFFVKIIDVLFPVSIPVCLTLVGFLISKGFASYADKLFGFVNEKDNK